MRVTMTTIFTPVQYIRVADLVISVNKMSGGPSTSVQRPIESATKAVRIISRGGDAVQDTLSQAPLLLRGGRYLRDLIRRIRLPPEWKGKFSFFPAPLDLYGNAFVGLVVAKPALGCAREGLAIQSNQNVSLFQARFARAAFPVHINNARGVGVVAIDGEAQRRAVLADVAKGPT